MGKSKNSHPCSMCPTIRINENMYMRSPPHAYSYILLLFHNCYDSPIIITIFQHRSVYYVNEIASEAFRKCHKRIDPMHTHISENFSGYNNINVTTTFCAVKKREREAKKKNFKSDPLNGCTWLEYKWNYFCPLSKRKQLALILNNNNNMGTAFALSWHTIPLNDRRLDVMRHISILLEKKCAACITPDKALCTWNIPLTFQIIKLYRCCSVTG